MDPGPESLNKRRIDYGFDPQRNQVVAGEGPAFYRILFRHHDDIARGQAQIIRGKAMMVGKGVARE